MMAPALKGREGRSVSANPIHQRGRPAARRNANAPLGARSRARASTPRAVPPTPAGSCSERSRGCRDRLQRVETGVSSARLILRPHASHSEAIQPHGLGLGGVLCGRFVLRTLSPVTVTEVWVGRGSVLRARARASNQDSFTRILFLPAVRTTRRTSAPSGWPRRGRLPGHGYTGTTCANSCTRRPTVV